MTRDDGGAGAETWEQAPCALMTLAAGGLIARVNETWLRWLGRTRAEVEGVMRFAEVLTPGSAATFRASTPTLVGDGRIDHIEVVLVRGDGGLMPMVLSATAVRDATGVFRGSRCCLLTAPTRRREPGGVDLLASLTHDLRTPLNAILGFGQLLRADRQTPLTPRQVAMLEHVLHGGEELLRMLDEMPEQIRVEAGRAASAGEAPSSRPPLFVLDALREGIQVLGPDWRYRHVNPAAARHGHTTPEALVGRTMMECYPGIEGTEMFAELTRVMQTAEPRVLENSFQYADGTTRVFELRIEPVPDGVCVLSIDITERKQAEAHARASEERMRHGERLESIGRLSAGIAHDFNNLLSVVLGQGEIALGRPAGPTVADVELMMDVARRSAVLTRELLAFGRRQVMRSRVVDPREVIAGLATILRRTLGSGVDLVIDVGEAVGAIDVDPAKLEQVLMNLVLNARDAMPGGGRICIGLAAAVLAAAEAERHSGAASGPHVVISVADDGVGMDAETCARIFEPFFTTKQRGHGTGLGLATVYGIVRQSGGTIWVYSEPGLGTTFKLYFPRAHTDAASAGLAEALGEAAEPEVVDVRGDESILVVEDHPSLRALAELSLASAGYRVCAAASGTLALELLTADPEIALVVTDVILPGMHGPELIERARQMRPALKFLCTSGYASESLEGRQALPRGVPFLEKPYLPSTLLRTVREILDGRAGAR